MINELIAQSTCHNMSEPLGFFPVGFDDSKRHGYWEKGLLCYRTSISWDVALLLLHGYLKNVRLQSSFTGAPAVVILAQPSRNPVSSLMGSVMSSKESASGAWKMVSKMDQQPMSARGSCRSIRARWLEIQVVLCPSRSYLATAVGRGSFDSVDSERIVRAWILADQIVGEIWEVWRDPDMESQDLFLTYSQKCSTRVVTGISSSVGSLIRCYCLVRGPLMSTVTQVSIA